MRQNHNIPIGTLVETKYDRWLEAGACIKSQVRLWVFNHYWDFDGTPLYTLSDVKPIDYKKHCDQFNLDAKSIVVRRLHTHIYEVGFTEEKLKPVEITDSVLKGEDVLKWDESE